LCFIVPNGIALLKQLIKMHTVVFVVNMVMICFLYNKNKRELETNKLI